MSKIAEVRERGPKGLPLLFSNGKKYPLTEK